MKEGWVYKKLGEVCDFEGGSQPPKSEWISSPKEGYVRMLQIRDFTKSRNADVEYVKLSRKLRLCKSDDILIGRYGASVGKILTGLAGAYNVAIIKSMPNEKLIDKRFIRRFFESSLFQSVLVKVCSSRTAQAGFSKDDIKDIDIPVPSLSDQHRIVSRLDSAFSHIDELKAKAEKQLTEAKALFQKALAEEMKPKEGWEEKTFGKVCTFSQGVQVPLSEQSLEKREGFSRFLRIIDYTQGTEPPRYVPITDKKYYMAKTDIALVRYGTPGFVCMGLEGVIANNLFKVNIIDKRELYSFYLFYFLKSPLFQNILKRNVVGAALQAISFGLIRDIVIPIPPLSDQQSIVARLDALSSHVRELEENCRKTLAECDALKQAMLREVFE